MNVYDEMINRYGGTVALAAQELDTNEAFRLRDEWQKMWDGGESFTLCPTREADTEEEIDACVTGLYNALRVLVEKVWFAKLSREQAVAIGNALLLTPSNWGKISVCKDVSYGVDDIADKWNDAHPGEEPIVYTKEAYSY